MESHESSKTTAQYEIKTVNIRTWVRTLSADGLAKKWEVDYPSLKLYTRSRDYEDRVGKIYHL